MRTQEEDSNYKINPISPKHNHSNIMGNNTSYYLNSRNFPENEKHSKNNLKNLEYSKLQNPSKLSKKKIAPIENKGIFMSKTNKNDFMKYINKTFQQEEGNGNFAEEQEINNKKNTTFKKMNDLTIQLNSPNNSNMKKTLNLYSIKNSNTNVNYTNKFNNLTSPTNMSSTSYSNQISSNDNLKNFLNSASNYNNINYPFSNNNLSPINTNHLNTIGYNKTRFLFDASNYLKFSKVDTAKFATKPAGIITSFGVNTNFGNVR